MGLLSTVLLAAAVTASSFGSAAQQSPGMGSTVTAPVPVYTPNPPYSEEALKAGVSGVVEVDIMVDAAGNVQDARVVKPLGHGLDEKALETIRTWRFKPAMHNGVPVGGSMTVQVRFQSSASPSQPVTQPPPSATPAVAQERTDEGPTNEKAQKTYKEALEYLHDGRPDAALDAFKKADKQDGGHCLGCQRQMVKYGMALGDWKTAEAAAGEMVSEAETPRQIALAHYQFGI